ncbi:MAG: 5-dehydro-2-deoxygluconokinase [Thermomicrobiales bacterium]
MSATVSDTPPEPTHDLLTIGRSSIDLYSRDIGAPFEEISGFAAYVGGCPTNVAVGATRLGLRVALLTAVGDDRVGDFILRFLDDEGVDTASVPRKPGHRSSAVILGIEPPDRFPLVFYRDNCADIELTIDDVLAAPVATSRALLITGTGLSKEPSRSATLFAAGLARAAGRTVALDLDFRADQWHDPRAFGITVRSALPLVDVVIGTEDEINASLLSDPAQLRVTGSQLSDARVGGDVGAAIATLLGHGPAVLVQKRGAAGARVHLARQGESGEPDGPKAAETIDVPGFPVEVQNILGAGDAFAAGLLFGLVRGQDWESSVRLGNACGAIVVTRPGCANFTPTHAEATAFIAAHDRP